MGDILNNIELENKIEELNNRLIKLEKIEKRRKTRLIIKIILYVVIVVTLILIGFKVYNYLNENIIKPINSVKDNEVIIDIKKLLEM